jgi:hypothetical protein
VQFVGLSKLSEVYDRLEHGAELSYEECVGISDEQVKQMIVPKRLLAVFREIKPRGESRPDYSSAEVLNEAHKLIDGEAEHEEDS